MRIALFGYQNIAQKHLAGLRPHLEAGAAELAGVAGRNVERAREMTSTFGSPPVFADYRELLAQVRPELVVIATPNFAHREMTLAALSAGAHVLCEKPLGVHADEVEEMYRTARSQSRMLIAGMSSRYARHAQWVKRELSVAPLAFRSGEARYLRARHIPGGIGFLSKEQAGGGVLLDLGTHLLDLVLWFWGDDAVIAAAARTRMDPAELTEEQRLANDYGQNLDLSAMDVEYEAEGTLHFGSGGTLTFHVSWASKAPRALYGPDADERAPEIALRASLGESVSWSLRESRLTIGGRIETLADTEAVQERYSRQITHALQVVRGEATPLVREQEVVRLHRIMDALYLSAAGGGKPTSLE